MIGAGRDCYVIGDQREAGEIERLHGCGRSIRVGYEGTMSRRWRQRRWLRRRRSVKSI